MFKNLDTQAYFANLSGGRKVVATNNTAIQVGTTPCNAVILQALYSNGANIMVGGSDVDITDGSEKGIELVPGETMTLYVRILTPIFIDSSTSGNGVSFLIMH